MGSHQDKFVPLYSAHLQPPTDLPDNDARSLQSAAWVRNILDSLAETTLIRLDVTAA